MKKITIISLALFILTSCSSSPDKTIQQRWKAVDVQGSERKKAKYQKLLSRHSTEFEFKAGKFTGYQDGVIQGTADYTLASDGKSLVVMDNGKPQITFRIISLKSKTMVAVMDGFMSDRDTIIFKAGGSNDDKD
ncbi:MAG: hypothetical protein ABIQ31_07630 [Ferruginibacter sp.]